jgi:glucan biosynthesis protein C
MISLSILENMTKPSRLFFIDNIRWLMIVFVVITHAAVTYSSIGMWYYTEPAKLDTVSLALFGIYQSFTQAYSMGLLFLIAGYFVPGSFDRKGLGRFLRDRAVRLGIPTLIYMLFINLAINYYILTFEWTTSRPSVIKYFLNYVQSLDFLSGSGPMWFALALLIFSAIYAAFRQMLPFLGNPKWQNPNGKLPGHLTVAGLALLISVCAFSIRLVQPIGTSLMNMQLGFFSQYIILFITGIIAYRKDWLVRIPLSLGVTWFKAALMGGSIFWLAIMILGGGLSGDFSKYAGGLYWQSAAYALWESFFCVGVCLGLIVLFREHFGEQGKLAKFMSDNYFSVYVFHPPILILVTLALKDLAWHPIIKFAVSCALAITLCFLASHFILRRIPLLKRP